MMKSALIASLLASSAAAFVPQQQPAKTVSTSSLAGAIDSMDGSINLFGKPFKFDPLQLGETYSPLLPWFRESEIRHGRTAMLAVVGFIVEDFVRIPGDMYSFQSIPKTVDAHDALLHNGPMYQLLLWIGLWDMVVTAPAAAEAMAGKREPGGTCYLTVYLRTIFAAHPDGMVQRPFHRCSFLRKSPVSYTTTYTSIYR